MPCTEASTTAAITAFVHRLFSFMCDRPSVSAAPYQLRDPVVPRPAISVGLARYSTSVTKRLIDIDDGKLAAVRELLGTPTLKATVDEAFDEVLALAQRRRALLADRGGDEQDLEDPGDRRAAWG